jgi:hypothetical protein
MVEAMQQIIGGFTYLQGTMNDLLYIPKEDRFTWILLATPLDS